MCFFPFDSLISEADADHLRFGYDGRIRVYKLQFACRLLQRDPLAFSIDNTNHVSISVVYDGLCSRRAQSGGQDPVLGAGAAAALGVTWNGDAHLGA